MAESSVGTLAGEKQYPANATHRMTKSAEYKIWTDIKTRCFNKNRKDYGRYGGRGITMHAEWVRSFEAFYRDLGPRPSPEHSVDRYPNNDGNYEPGNVRWATRSEQARNKRNNCSLTINGTTKLIIEWAEESGTDFLVIWKRIKRGWSPERSVFEKIGSCARSSTGVRGVYKRYGKFVVSRFMEGKVCHIGTFDTLEEATAARTNP